MNPLDRYNATIVAKTMITPELFTFWIKPDRDVEPFQAGQYSLLGISSDNLRREGSDPEFKPVKPGRLILRAYSIASSGNQTDMLEFYISVVSNGSLTPRLVQLNPGDRLHLGEKIRGHFTLESLSPNHDTVLLVATGTGLAPYVSMMREQLYKKTDHKFVILHGGRYTWEMGYMNEMRLYPTLFPNVSYIPIISRPKVDQCWRGPTGRLTQFFQNNSIKEMAGIDLDPAHTSVYLCGNPKMISDIAKVLEVAGHRQHSLKEPGTIHIEEYW